MVPQRCASMDADEHRHEVAEPIMQLLQSSEQVVVVRYNIWQGVTHGEWPVSAPSFSSARSSA